VIGNVVDTRRRSAASADGRRLALDKRNDDFAAVESGGVKGGAKILGSGGDRRSRLRSENLIAELNAYDSSSWRNSPALELSTAT
jgi:hypothetical protein